MAPVVAAAGTRLVVVGGGMADAGRVLLDPLRADLADRLPDPDGVEVVTARLGSWAAAVGASHLGREGPPAVVRPHPTDGGGSDH